MRGSGTPVAHTELYKWPVKDVVAVFEVKKRLFSSELTDAYSQLRGVLDLFWSYAENLGPADSIDIESALYAYGQIVGHLAPQRTRVPSYVFSVDAEDYCL